MGLRAVALLAVALSVAGCIGDRADDEEDVGGDAGPASPPPPPPAPELFDVSVELEGAFPVNIAYAPSTIDVPAGRLVHVTFTNTDLNPLANHDWVLEGVEGAATDTIANGESAETEFLAPPPGDHLFFCSVQGHRDAGMEGTLTVT